MIKKGLLLVLLAAFSGACGKLPINGDLDGRWQIMKIAYADGREETPERAYYSISLHTINLMQVGGRNETGNMEYTGDSLFVEMPISKTVNLRVFGMDSTVQHFGVDELSSRQLVLNSGYARLQFRKF